MSPIATMRVVACAAIGWTGPHSKTTTATRRATGRMRNRSPAGVRLLNQMWLAGGNLPRLRLEQPRGGAPVDRFREVEALGVFTAERLERRRLFRRFNTFRDHVHAQRVREP